MTGQFEVCRFACVFACFLALVVADIAHGQESKTQASPPGSFMGFMDGIKHGSVVYSRGENYELKCDIYVPNGDGPHPAILAIHGGAWRGGTKLHMLRHAFKFCNDGFVVVCINYRHAPEFPFPAQTLDGFAALRFMGEQAATYRIDPNNVFGFGYSAGGHLISLIATTSERDWLVADKQVTERTAGLKIKAVAAGGAPCDFDWVADDSTSLKYWLCATKQEDADLYRRASPICHVTPNSPPFLLFHGSDDFVVPPECTDRMQAALQKQSVFCEVTKLPKCGHIGAFSHLEIVDQASEFFRQQMTKTSPPPSVRQ